MISRTTLLRHGAALALASALIVPAATAQRCDGPALNPEQTAFRTRAVSTLGTQAIDYWIPKLNTYREQIDRTLSPADLETLRRLRVRWALLVEEGIDRMKEKNAAREEGAETAVRGNEMKNLGEMMDIFMAAKVIATRYRPQMTALGEQVIEDVGGFGEEMRGNISSFTRDNRMAIEADPELRTHLTNDEEIGRFATSLRSEKTRKDIRSAWNTALETVVMLFDGGDLLRMVERAMPGGMNLAGATGGMELPNTSALRQNFPNPASGTTTVPFLLGESASGATMRLYNSKGDAVRTVELGALQAGENSATLDVAGLPAGTYLYHLTVTTPNGTRVWSKSMQVVR